MINLKLQHNATILLRPRLKFIQQINKLIFYFLWSKKDRIIGKTLTGKENKGGIDINYFESKLKASKASWIPRLTNTKSSFLPFMENLPYKENLSLRYIQKTNLEYLSDYKEAHKLPTFY